MASEGGMGEPAVKVQQFIEGWEAHLPESDITAEKKTLTSFVTENSNISTAMVEELEVVCGETPQQHEALQCKGCSKWYQWTCTSGSMHDLYKQLVSGTDGLDWRCHNCSRTKEMHTYATETIPISMVVNEPSTDQAVIGQVDNASNDVEYASLPTVLTEQELNNIRRMVKREYAPMPDWQYTDENGISYVVMEDGTQRGRGKMADSNGYTYTIKKAREGLTYWWCSVRSKKLRCPASVTQEAGGIFKQGLHGHVHAGQEGLVSHVKIRAKVRAMAKENLTQTAAAIVQHVLDEEMPGVLTKTPKGMQLNLMRVASRARQALRQEEMRNMEFEGADEFIAADYEPRKVVVNEKRHLLFVSDVQLQCLGEAKQWYVDVTTKALRPPYTRLLSLHTYVRQDEQVKHMPLAFCLMSRTRKNDYKQVLKELRDALPSAPPVKEIVAAFDKGLWQAASKTFRTARLRGCLVHWMRAIWSKVEELELESNYLTEDHTYKLIQRLMVLPLLPAEHMEATFHKLQAQVSQPLLHQLLRYIEYRWFGEAVWPVAAWSVHGLSTRTPADAEGWHYHVINHVTRYPLSVLLHKEAGLLQPDMKPMSEKRVCRYQRKHVPKLQYHIFQLWMQFETQELTINDLLKLSSHLVSLPMS